MLKFWTIAGLTLASSILLFMILIRPVPIMRLFFGLKPKDKTKS